MMNFSTYQFKSKAEIVLIMESSRKIIIKEVQGEINPNNQIRMMFKKCC